MRILYLGEDIIGSTSLDRAEALRRLGHDVQHVNLRELLPRWKGMMGLNVRTGFRLVQPLIYMHLHNSIGSATFDLCWISCGCEIGPRLLRFIKKRCKKLINYNNDDPFGTRDGCKWDLYKKCVPFYDLTVVVREPNIIEAFNYGAKRVIHAWMTYDSISHLPFSDPSELKGWQNEVVFVGSWMPERGPFLSQLIQMKVPLAIWGDRWDKAREWPQLRTAWRGVGLYGKDYVRAIQGAKIALGLLSKGNRDLHTTRSMEIPFIGGAVFCGERTIEHDILLQENSEGVFWSTPEECAYCCHSLLRSETSRAQIATAARARIIQCRLSNDEVIAAILALDANKHYIHQFVTLHTE